MQAHNIIDSLPSINPVPPKTFHSTSAPWHVPARSATTVQCFPASLHKRQTPKRIPYFNFKHRSHRRRPTRSTKHETGMKPNMQRLLPMLRPVQRIPIRDRSRWLSSTTTAEEHPRPSIFGYPVGPFQMNMFAFACSETDEAAIIDVGADTAEEFNQFKTFIDDNGFKVTSLLQTHGHVDHVVGLRRGIAEWPDAQRYVNHKEKENWEGAADKAADYGFQTDDPQLPRIEEFTNLANIKSIQVGKIELEVLFTPGHAPGHCCFYSALHKVLIGGDLLFNGSIGRTDLPGCSEADMNESLRFLFDKLEDEVVVLPGHGSLTTILQERTFNPLVLMALSKGNE